MDNNVWLASEYGCADNNEGIREWSIWRIDTPGRTYMRSSWGDEGCRRSIGIPCDNERAMDLYINWTRLADARVADRIGAFHELTVAGFGWPMRAGWSATEEIVDCNPPPARPKVRRTHGLSIHNLSVNRVFGIGPPRILPTRPIWPGFLFNSVFYSLVVFLPLFTVGFVLRWNRRRRGLCGYCKYPRGESAICSECGKSHTS